MQLGDLVKPLSQMSDAELLEKLREVRNNRTVVRPAARAHVERAEKKVSRTRTKKASSLLESLSPEERQRLIEQLQQGELDV